MSESAIEILIGGNWQYDLKTLAEIQSFRRGGDAFDFWVIQDTIDIVVEGANITALLPEESIFYVMSDLIGGLSALWEGRQDKYILEFESRPYELALQRGRDGFEISFYGTGSQGQVIIHNFTVNPLSLARVAEQATVRIIDDLLRLNRRLSGEGVIKGMLRRLRQLRQWVAGQPQPVEAHTPPPLAGPVSVTAGDGKLSLLLTFDGAHPDFWRYQGIQSSDLHSLLFRGSLILRYRGKQRTLAQDAYLFPLLESLVAGTEYLLHNAHLPLSGAVLLDPDTGASCLLAAEQGKDNHILLRVREPDGRMGQTKTTRDRWIALVLDLSTQFCASIGQLNPRQLLNDRINDLVGKVRGLRQQFNTLRQGNIYCSPIDSDGESVPQVEQVVPPPPPDGQMPHPLDRMRHLFLRSTWFLARREIDLKAMTPFGPWLLVPSYRQLECVERRGGEIRWRMPCDRLVTTSPELALVTQDRVLVALDLDTGKPAWVSPIAGTLNDARVYLRDGKPTAFCTVADTRLVSLELQQGQVEWEFQLEHGEITGLVWAQPVLAVGASDGYTYGLSPNSGELLWRHHVPGAGVLPPFPCANEVILCAETEPGSGATLVGIAPSSGVMTRQYRLPASPVDLPWLVQSVALFVLEPMGHCVLMAVDVTTWCTLWSLPIDSAAVDSTVLSWIPGGDDSLILVKSDYGICSAVQLCTGRLIWSIALLEKGDLLLHNLAPTLLGEHLVIPERFLSIVSPRDGRRLHRLTSLPEHISYLDVDGSLRMIVAEGTDHLECFDLKGFLALL